MKRPVRIIKEQYEKFNSLVRDPKISSETVIVFDKIKPSRPDTIFHTSFVKHHCFDDSISLLAEQKKSNRASYKFQLHCKDFYEEPYFRFDSDGSAHKNSHLPLRNQSVTTPHFNTYDEHGRSVAYKTPALEEIEPKDIIDMNRFFQLFCEECYLRCEDDLLPNIISGPVGEISFPDENEDFLSNINFDV